MQDVIMEAEAAISEMEKVQAIYNSMEEISATVDSEEAETACACGAKKGR